MAEWALHCFKAYDIRGIAYDELDNKFAERLGKALGTFLDASNIAVGRDIRESSPTLHTAFVSGSWELSFMISISYFIILTTSKKNNLQIIFYLILTILILYFSANRTIIVSFLISLMTYFVFKSKVINTKLIVYLFLVILPFVSIFVLNENELQSLDEYNYKRIIKSC